MPAMALPGALHRHRLQARATLEAGEVEQPGALAEALVSLLQRHDIGVDLADHLDDPVGIEAAIAAHGLVDVVGGDPELRGRRRAGERRLASSFARPARHLRRPQHPDPAQAAPFEFQHPAGVSNRSPRLVSKSLAKINPRKARRFDRSRANDSPD
ncbi:hypothetical protein BOSE62_50131 [Bosea sp. 62]|nr:hypothetical protein BOSE62_50131 [Bosea sp. 62]VXC89339.1 hypothetical protein BOSE127_70136 [Bosea sp. 127]